MMAADFLSWLNTEDGPIAINCSKRSPVRVDITNTIGESWQLSENETSSLRAAFNHPQLLVVNFAATAPLIKGILGHLPAGMTDLGLVGKVLNHDLAVEPPARVIRTTLELLQSATPKALDRVGKDHQLATVVRQCTERGLVVDRRSLDLKRQELAAWISEIDGLLGFNPRSEPQLKAWLTANGAEPPPGEMLTIDEASLASLSCSEQPGRLKSVAGIVLGSRRIQGQLQQLNDLHHHLTERARVHPVIDVAGARTSRMTCSRPALQGLQKDLRYLLLADSGNVLVNCDLNQVEARVAAALSQDAKLIDAVNSSDIYASVAADVFGTEPSPAQRQTAKLAMLMTMYGGGVEAVIAKTGLNQTAAISLQQQLRHTYPVFEGWQQHLTRQASATNPFGRTFRIRHDLAYKSINHMIQSTARDLFADVILDAHTLGLDLWLPLHDELIVLAPRQHVGAVAKQLQEVMTTEFLGVPITATVHVLGARWGTKTSDATM